MRRAGIAKPAVSPGHPDHIPVVVTGMEGRREAVFLRTHHSQRKGEKSQGGRKGIMKKSYSVLALTCLIAVFTIFMVLTPAYGQEKTAIPPAPVPEDVNPTDLPEKFNQLKMGMTADEVQALLGWPATIQPMGEGKRQWKYFLPGGVARLFLNFQDNKIVSFQQLTP